METLPKLLETLEQEIDELSQQTQSSDFYQRNHLEQSKVLDALAQKNEALEEAFMRWGELEQKRSQM